METELTKILEELNNINYTFREKLDVDDNINFGLELEYDNVNRSEIQKHLKMLDNNYKYCDNKIIHFGNYNGECEIKSKVLSNNIEDLKSLKKLCYYLNLVNASHSKKRKGMHIHTDLSYLEEDLDSLHLLLKLICNYEHIIYRFAYGKSNYSNNNINFCQETSNLLFKYLKREDLSTDFYDNIVELRKILTNKSYSLNFHKKDSSVKQETIEFRQFNSTKDIITIENNINLILNMLNKVKSKEIDRDLLDFRLDEHSNAFYTIGNYSSIYLNDAIEFCDLVFNNDLDKDYFLKQYLMEDKKKKRLVY